MKVYSKNKDNAETFYKDGYTDLRGRFDYASLSSSNFKEIEKFSMLIYHEELGIYKYIIKYRIYNLIGFTSSNFSII